MELTHIRLNSLVSISFPVSHGSHSSQTLPPHIYSESRGRVTEQSHMAQVLGTFGRMASHLQPLEIHITNHFYWIITQSENFTRHLAHITLTP